jgi:polyferredoxin
MSEPKSDKKAQRASRALRLVVLLVFLAGATVVGMLHQVSRSLAPVGVDALCPFGGIESAWALVTAGQLLQRIALSSFILLGATVVIAVVFRRSFCGNVCAFGALQELLGRLGRKLFRQRPLVPVAVDKPLRWLRYVVLAAVAVLSAVLGTLVIRPFDPWAAYNHLLSPELFTALPIGFAVLVGSLLLSVVFERFFCKYLCPMGGVLGLVGKIGLFKVRRNKETCIDCMACDKACPVNIKVQSMEKVTTAECLMCSECVNRCPVQNTLYYEGPGKKRLSPNLLLILTLVVFAAVVGSTVVTGTFKLTETPLTEKATATGTFDPATITGRNTFKEVANLSGIPPAAFLERFKITENEFEAPIRDAAHKEGSGFDTTAVKDFVKEELAKKNTE